MSTFRFGSSVGPARITGSSHEVRKEDEGEIEKYTSSTFLDVKFIIKHACILCRFVKIIYLSISGLPNERKDSVSKHLASGRIRGKC